MGTNTTRTNTTRTNIRRTNIRRTNIRRTNRTRTISRLVGSLTAVVIVSGLLAGSLPPAGADDVSQAGDGPIGVLLPDDRLTPSLAGFEVEGAAYSAAYRSWTDTLADVADARRTVDRNQALVVDLDAQRVQLRASLEDRRALLRGVVYELDGLDIAMRQLAVASYTRGGPVADAAAMFEIGDVTDDLYSRQLERDASDDQVRRRRSLRSEIDRLQSEIGSLTTQLGELADRSFAATAAIAENRERAARQSARLPALEVAVRDARMSAMVVGTDIPLVALDAYVRAGAKLAAEKPQCALRWTMIAALGRIESKHGNINGATLRADGRTTVRIVGIALSGEDNTARIPDSDDGQLDGDADLDRAVGPMQFIPATWMIYRRDGNGDGTADPQNIYDAALTTAAYLCSSGKALTNTDNLRAAYLAYNRSTTYVSTAFANEELYRRITFPPVPRPG